MRPALDSDMIANPGPDEADQRHKILACESVHKALPASAMREGQPLRNR
jgi:hypothetical protein